jgi:proteic killer suppression protein
MDVDFEDASLRRLEADPRFTADLDAAVVKAFRKRMQFIRAAVDERAFRAMKSLHYEKLQGDRAGKNSMRLNDQWRLILRIRQESDGKCVVVVSIIDYH